METELSADVLLQNSLIFLIVFFVALVVTWIAFHEGYFKYTSDKPIEPVLDWSSVLKAFAFFLVIELVLLPTLYFLWLSWEAGELLTADTFRPDYQIQVWINMIGIFCTALAIGTYYASFDKHTRQVIWGTGNPNQRKFKILRNLAFGAFSWFIAYPWIVAFSQLIGIILRLVHAGSHAEQVAVKHVKQAIAHPLLLWVMVAVVAIVVPIIEELLFRGFMQTWLKGILGKTKAILIVSAVFAVFHFSASQGFGNIELLAALFLLSCFLGFVKEKQDSLWASIGLHSTFNSISITIILFTSGLF